MLAVTVVAALVALGLWLASNPIDEGTPGASSDALVAPLAPGLSAAPARGAELARSASEVAPLQPVDPAAQATAAGPGGVLVRGVVRSAGAPLPDADVWLVPSQDQLEAHGWRRSHAGRDWRTKLPRTRSLADGTFELEVDAVLLARSPRAMDGCLAFASVVVGRAGFELVPRRCTRPRAGVVDLGVIELGVAPLLTGRVLDCRGEPAADVHLRLLQGRRPMHGKTGKQCSDPFGELLTARSAADGSFVLASRAPGQARLELQRDDLGELGPLDLELRPGEQDLGSLRFACAGEVSGRVLDPRGEPLVGARVVVSTGHRMSHPEHGEHELATLTLNALLSQPRAPTQARTDAQGAFRLHDMADQNHTVVVEAPGHGRRLLENVGRGASLDVVLEPLEGARLLIVEQGSERPVPDARVTAWRLLDAQGRGSLPLDVLPPSALGEPHVLLAPGAGDLLVTLSAPGFATRAEPLRREPGVDPPEWRVELAPGTSIAGSVRSTAGVAIDGARVELWATDEPGAAAGSGGPGDAATAAALRLFADQPVQVVRSDAAGVFRLEGLPAGTWRLVASADGYLRARRRVLTAVGAAQPDVQLTLGATGTLAGQLRRLDGSPVSRGRVTLERPLEEAQLIRPVTEKDGTFERRNLVPGEYVVSARGAAPVVVEVVAGERAWVELVELERTRVVGRVSAPGVQGARGHVFIYGADVVDTTKVTASGSLDAEGRFDVILQPGRYVVHGYLERAGRTVSAPFEIAAGQTVTVDLVFAGAGLEGRVVDAQTGDPVADAEIMARRVDAAYRDGRPLRISQDGLPFQLWPRSDAEGVFRMAYLAPGDYELTSQADGHVAGPPVVVRVPGGGSPTLRLPRAARIEGLARISGTNVPVRLGTYVNLLREDGTIHKSTHANSGRFAFDGLPAGTYSLALRDLAVHDDEPPTALVTVTVLPGTLETVELFVDP